MENGATAGPELLSNTIAKSADVKGKRSITVAVAAMPVAAMAVTDISGNTKEPRNPTATPRNVEGKIGPPR